MALELDRALLLASGAAMVVLAAIILASGPGRRLNRALAAVIAVRGVGTLLPQVSAEAQWTWTAINVQPYFAIAIVPLAAYCLAALGADAGGRMPRWAGAATLATVAVLDGLYLLDHTLFHTLADGQASAGALQATATVRYAAFGPLAAFASLASLMLAVIGLRLALLYRAAPDGARGTAALLMATGFLLGALFDGASRLAALAALLDSGAAFPWAPWGWAVMGLPVAALGPAALTLLLLAAGRTTDPRPHHVLEGRVLLVALFAFASGFLRLAVPATSDPTGRALVLVLLGVWRLSMPVLVAYGFLVQAWDGVGGRTREVLSWALLGCTLLLPGLAVGLGAAQLAPTPVSVLAAALAMAGLGIFTPRLIGPCRSLAAWLVPRPLAVRGLGGPTRR